MKQATVFLSLFFLNLTLYAQLPAKEVGAVQQIFPKEKIKLSTNTNILLAGETLLYKGYCRTEANSASMLSKILYVSLRSAKDSIVFQHKLKVKNDIADGYYFLPANLKTGVYELIAYTNHSRNNEIHQFDQTTIYIINSFLTPETISEADNNLHKISLDSSAIGHTVRNDKADAAIFQNLKTTYSKRSKVEISLRDPDISEHNKDYSLSVRKVDPLTIVSGKKEINPVKTSQLTYYIPELRGELISGIVSDKNNGQPISNKMVALTIPGKDYVFELAKTNENGRFFFAIDEPYATSKANIQIKDTDRNGYRLTLDDKKFSSNNLVTNRTLELDKSLKNWIEDRSIKLQIQNAYYDANKEQLESLKVNPRFFGNLGTTYLLDDYTRFPTVKETFIEVIKLAAIRSSGKESKFIVFDEYNFSETGLFSELPTLLLMDGMLIQNNDEVLGYDARDIQSIQVVAEAYRLGPQIYSGIIAIHTKKGNFIPIDRGDHTISISLDQPLPSKEHYSPDYQNENLDRTPDNRVQLVWLPQINITEQHTIDFYTSDVTGTFEIALRGFDKDGKFTKSVAYFSVE